MSGDLTLDLRTRRATVEGRTVELTAREFALAEVFLRHEDYVLTREQLLSRVWGFDFDPDSKVVDVYVRYLRRKLGNDRIRRSVAPATGCGASFPRGPSVPRSTPG